MDSGLGGWNVDLLSCVSSLRASQILQLPVGLRKPKASNLTWAQKWKAWREKPIQPPWQHPTGFTEGKEFYLENLLVNGYLSIFLGDKFEVDLHIQMCLTVNIFALKTLKVLILEELGLKKGISWLNSSSDSEFGPIDWLGSGLLETCSDFRTVRHDVIRTLKSFSRRVTWTKRLPGTRPAAICLELLRVIAEAREARMMETCGNPEEQCRIFHK
ncbi:hypothetical protein SADUNF_Sadunf12G0017700 [Salix dunnii]|uniref:Uncharacterized protein n=1 Tax=Salix dunnii TaxID=1413687 RepID=A0A835MRW7_9ROSI|nr:hypothetical protein SADUNF_Sadunf12G0017700 [Salix dunnii]